MTKSKLILIDLDDTLFQTPAYELNAPEPYALIEKYQKKGYLIGLNSDSPLPWLQYWSGRLGMKGPIIAEGGAIILPDSHSKPIFLVNNKHTAQLTDLQTRLAQEVTKSGEGAVLLGDVVKMRRDGLLVSPSIDRLIAISTLRQASFMCYVLRSSKNGKIHIGNIETIQEIAQTIKKLLPTSGYTINVDQGCGVIITQDNKTNKMSAVAYLRKLFPDRQVYMIGNSLSDWCGEGVHHIAVSNASVSFQSRAERVCQKPYTQGVIEFIESLE